MLDVFDWVLAPITGRRRDRAVTKHDGVQVGAVETKPGAQHGHWTGVRQDVLRDAVGGLDGSEARPVFRGFEVCFMGESCGSFAGDLVS